MEKKENLIYFVTGNNNKFNEVLRSFQQEDLNYTLEQLKLEPTEIQAETVKDVALFKLNSIKEKINNSFFIEDAGFFVDRPLKGFPGVYSSYVFKTIGNEGIIKLINNFENSVAHFEAVVALYFKPLDKVLTFEGETKGRVSQHTRGTGGFGYDPIFIPDLNSEKSFAELSMEQKNKISHRGQAIRKLISFLKKNTEI
jgi:XTP/dITP diphosphohydrolase